MGRGVDDRGLPYISLTFGRGSDAGDVVRRLEQALGFTFVLSNSLGVFSDNVGQSLMSAAINTKGNQLELIFTRRRWNSWRDTRDSPASDILVQSRAEKAQRDQWAQEDAREASLKKQRAADYTARMEAQKKDDEAKLVLRDGDGKVLFSLYDIQHRGSDFAGKLNASFDVYTRSGFDDKYLKAVINDYFGVLISQITDLKDFNKFLMSESSTYKGRFITWTGAITRPNLTGPLEAYEAQLWAATGQYKTGTPADAVLDKMALVEVYCGHASKQLNDFYNKSVSHASRIALAIQIAQFAIPVGASAAFVEALCIEAAQKFSYAITNKIVNGSDQSWLSTLSDAAIGSVRDTIMRVGVSKLVGKIPKVSTSGGIPGEAMRFAVNTLASELAQSMGSFFQGATFGEALANLYRNLKNPETWVLNAVNHAANAAFGKYLDLPQAPRQTPPTLPEGSGTVIKPAKKPEAPRQTPPTLPEGSGTVIKPVKKPARRSKKPAAAVTVALMFGSAGHAAVDLHANKPTVAETRGTETSQGAEAKAKRPNYLDPGTDNKGLGSRISGPHSDDGPPKAEPLDRKTKNATAGPDQPVKTTAATSGQGSKPPTKPPRTPAVPPPTGPGRRKRRNNVERKAAYRRLLPGIEKRKHTDNQKKRASTQYQMDKTGLDYEYYMEFETTDRKTVRIHPDGFSVADDGKKINIDEYKHLEDPISKDDMDDFLDYYRGKNFDDIMDANKHWEYMGGKFGQMMGYVEALLKFPDSFDKVIYHCSDPATALTYQVVLDNLRGASFYGNRPSRLKMLDRIEIRIDPPT